MVTKLARKLFGRETTRKLLCRRNAKNLFRRKSISLCWPSTATRSANGSAGRRRRDSLPNWLTTRMPAGRSARARRPIMPIRRTSSGISSKPSARYRPATISSSARRSATLRTSAPGPLSRFSMAGSSTPEATMLWPSCQPIRRWRAPGPCGPPSRGIRAWNRASVIWPADCRLAAGNTSTNWPGTDSFSSVPHRDSSSAAI